VCFHSILHPPRGHNHGRKNTVGNQPSGLDRTHKTCYGRITLGPRNRVELIWSYLASRNKRNRLRSVNMGSGDSEKSVSREIMVRRAYVKNVLQLYFAYAWKDQPAQKIDFSKNRKFEEAVQDVVQNHARKSILHGFVELWDID
jgi:hypothetical protein